MIDNQQNHGADYRDEETVQVESAYATGAKNVKEPTAGEGADNTQQNVEQDALASPVDDFAADESCNQTENHPREE